MEALIHQHAGEPLRLPDRRAWLIDNRAHAIEIHANLDAVMQVLGDELTCCDCGHAIRTWCELHNLNGDHADWRRSNLAPICGFCHRTHHPGAASLLGELVLVWLPEFTQVEAIRLARLLHVATFFSERQEVPAGADVAREGRMALAAATLLGSQIRERQQRAERVLGTSEPHRLIDMIWALPPDAQTVAIARTAGVRYWPTADYLRWEQSGYRQRGAEMILGMLGPTGTYGQQSATAWAKDYESSLESLSIDPEQAWAATAARLVAEPG